MELTIDDMIKYAKKRDSKEDTEATLKMNKKLKKAEQKRKSQKALGDMKAHEEVTKYSD